MEKIFVSPSPHIHSGDSVKKNMYGVIVALLPAFAASLWFFGLGALIVTLTAIVGCIVVEYVIQRFVLKVESTITDGSAVLSGMLLAFNVPSNLPIWMILVGAIVTIGIAKMSFGGLGNNPFNPALIGRVFLLISFPVQMTSWPLPEVNQFVYTDAQTGATLLGIVKEGLAKGDSMSSLMAQLPSFSDLLMGKMGGSLGEVSAIALLIGFGYMLWKKIITWHIPVSMIASVAIFAGILHFANPEKFMTPTFHIFSGGLLLGAIFMATDYVTSPMTTRGMLIYGALIGILTVLIRVFGAYPEGVSFAILIMNAFTPLINKYVKPKRFGEVAQ